MWTDPWVGRPYVPGEDDCLAEVLAAERGVDLRVVAQVQRMRDWRRWTPAEIEDLYRDVAVATETPVDGDGVLMRIRGRRRDLGSHVGLHASFAGEPWVLHSLEGVGSVCVREASLPQMQLERVGYYAWLPVDG